MKASRKSSIWLILLPLVMLFAFVGAQAQQNSLITGTVLDKLGAAIPGADISLTGTATGFTSTTKSNDSGNFSFPGLNVGTYDLKVVAKGFQTSVQNGLAVNVSQTLHVDSTMVVGAVDQTITVEANALVVQTDSNVLSTLVSADQISEIATENRNFSALVALGLGVSSNLPDNNTPTSVGSSASFSVNGLRQSHNIWLIDGGEADDRGGAGGSSIEPSQDAIAQIETLSSNYPPDYGISSGATISLSLKSGTQHFHGGAWEFNRNTVFNANDVLSKRKAVVPARSKLNYNIYGFNIGGPLWIPKVYNEKKDKTFFFWNEEWRKLIQGSGVSTVNAAPAGNFPVAGQALHYAAPAFTKTTANPTGTVITVPVTSDPILSAKFAADGLVQGQPFPNQTIPADLFDPTSLLYLKTGILPAANAAGDHFVGQASTPITVRDDVARIDHRFSQKWQILGHYIHDDVSQGSGAPMIGWSGASYPTITSTFTNPSTSAAIKVTGQLGPSLLVEASFNYDGNKIDIVNSPNSLLPAGWNGQKFFANGAKSVPNVHLNGAYGVQENPGSAPWHNAANDYEPKVDVSYTAGKHQMKFGASFNKYVKNQKLFVNAQGDASFNTQTQDSFVDLILGLVSGYSESQAAPIRHYVNNTPSVYAMDTWHVTQRLSLQLGLRYDALPHAFEKNNLIGNFNPNRYLTSAAPIFNNGLNGTSTDGNLNPSGPGFQTYNGGRFYLNGVDIAGQPGVPPGLVNNDYKTLQPRVGFSEDLFGNGKTVLRGGFGTFYERIQGNDIYNAATAAPFVNTPGASNVYFSNTNKSFTTGATAASPFGVQGSTTIAQTYKAPAVAQFSFGVQHQLAPSVIWVVQYVGNIAWHQNINRNINTYSLNTPLLSPNTNTNLGTNYQLYTRANAGDPKNLSGTNPTNPTQYQLGNAGNQLRNFPGFGGITQQEDTTNGNYEGFQTGLRAQNRWGLSGEFDYTYSHEIDITSTDLAGIDNPFNIKYNKGSGGFDRRHIISINYIYKLPIFTKPGFTHSTLGGWEIAGTSLFETGVPVTPRFTLNYDTIGLGGGYNNRPNVVGKIRKVGSDTKWFDTTQFSFPTPAWAGGANQGFGNAGKDAIVGPGRVQFTTSLYKTFNIWENINFQFRLESFNTFNHTERNGVSNTFGSGNFGAVTSYFDPRSVELGGKLTF